MYRLNDGDGKVMAFGSLEYLRALLSSNLDSFQSAGISVKRLPGFALDTVLIQNETYATVWSIQESK